MDENTLHQTGKKPFRVEYHGNIAILDFCRRDVPIFCDLSAAEWLWEFFERQEEMSLRVLVIKGSMGFLGTASNDSFRASQHDDSLSLLRLENGLLRFVKEVSQVNSITIGQLQGEVDSIFFGAALALDYRVAADDTFIVNRILRPGLPPIGALAWFLVRYLGPGRATRMLLNNTALSAHEAYELGLVDEVFPLESLRQETLDIAKGIASKPMARLLAAKELTHLSSLGK